MKAALEGLKNKKGSLRAIAKKHGVPRAALHFKIMNPEHREACGPLPVLSTEEEITLVRLV